MQRIIVLVALLISFNIIAQQPTFKQKKQVNALRIDKSPNIDGVLDEDFWENAEEAKDFFEFRPGDGAPETTHKTVVKIAYDNHAIYFGATLFDPNPANIPTQFTTRDNIGNADFFLISINPNNDGQNDTEFLVTSAGTQADAKLGERGEDWSWSAVWDSSVKINDDNWVVEMKIPYSALRFANSDGIQTWGVNLHRKIVSTNQQFSWNYIDKSSGLFTQFSGEILGIQNINPPVRLSLYPYASAISTTYDGDSDFDYNYGMDLKYGISESFTLDATLIPDFGQTAFDDVVLNLGPFEKRYDEKRAFFTEGTELFNKGRLFYSRRIGNTPTKYYDVEDMELENNEKLLKNPSKVDMLNAVKVSGRTKGGLGIGVFNAITEKTYAKIEDENTGETRKIVTEPFSNYNVLVLDQQFNKTSSVSFVNTNVLREGNFKDANVSALLFNILNKKNTHYIDGSFKMSNTYENGDTNSGFFGDLSIGKSSGNHQYEMGVNVVDKNYDINDLGFFYQTNYKRFYGRYSYRIFEPKGIFDNYGLNVWGNVNFLYNPNTFTSNSMGISYWANTRKRFSMGGNTNFSLSENKDFYEPRTEDFSQFLKQNPYVRQNIWFSTDYRKKFAFDFRVGGFTRINDDEVSYWVEIEPRYRFSDKFQLAYELELDYEENEKGWV
ncbi:MAG TPA: DUF5916 domain-containing protein, partial [Flavobacteriaceae bacterium]|nr:DUF5916 domain-containing protein [Flavobacteriaceae bacterium]